MRNVSARNLQALLERAVAVVRADPEAADTCRRILLPLTREDAERGNNLMATLRAYYASALRVDKTAERMFLHRNSVRYRLDRIRSLLRADIDDPKGITAYMLALALDEANAGRSFTEHAV